MKFFINQINQIINIVTQILNLRYSLNNLVRQSFIIYYYELSCLIKVSIYRGYIFVLILYILNFIKIVFNNLILIIERYLCILKYLVICVILYFLKIVDYFELTFLKVFKLLLAIIFFNLFLFFFINFNIIYYNLEFPSNWFFILCNLYFFNIYIKSTKDKLKFIFIKIIFFILFLYTDLFKTEIFAYSKTWFEIVFSNLSDLNLFVGTSLISISLLCGIYYSYLKPVSQSIKLYQEANENLANLLSVTKNQLKEETVLKIKLENDIAELKSVNVVDNPVYMELNKKYQELSVEHNKKTEEYTKTLKEIQEKLQKSDSDKDRLNKVITEINDFVDKTRHDFYLYQKQLDSLRNEVKQLKEERVQFQETIKNLNNQLVEERKGNFYIPIKIKTIYDDIWTKCIDLNNKIQFKNFNFYYKYKNFEIKPNDNVNYLIFNNILKGLNSVMFSKNLTTDILYPLFDNLNIFFNENIDININKNTNNNQNISNYLKNDKINKENVIHRKIVKLQKEIGKLVNDFDMKVSMQVQEVPIEKLLEQKQVSKLPEVLVDTKDSDSKVNLYIANLCGDEVPLQEKVKVEINTELFQEVKTEAEVPVLEQKEDEEIKNNKLALKDSESNL